jgi:hypothetical protein
MAQAHRLHADNDYPGRERLLALSSQAVMVQEWFGGRSGICVAGIFESLYYLHVRGQLK